MNVPLREPHGRPRFKFDAGSWTAAHRFPGVEKQRILQAHMLATMVRTPARALCQWYAQFQGLGRHSAQEFHELALDEAGEIAIRSVLFFSPHVFFL